MGGLGRAWWAWAGAVSLCAGAALAETRPAVRGARDAGQWQADPRGARRRYPAGAAAFLSPRRAGAADGLRDAGPRADLGLWADHPVEFPFAYAGLEGGAGACGG